MIHVGFVGIIPKYRYQKKRFREEFNEVFGVDISDEDPLIFPENICKSHGAVLYRQRACKKAGKLFSTSLHLTEFNSHQTDNCKLCESIENKSSNINEVRKKSGPGRGNRGSLIVTENETHIDEVGLLSSEETSTATSSNKSLFEFYRTIPDDCKNSSLDHFIIGLSLEEKQLLLDKIIKSEHKNIVNDTDEISKEKYTSITDIHGLDVQDYLEKRNSILLTFLKSVSTKDKIPAFNLAILLECLYKLKNPNFLGPVSLLHNIYLLSITNSKTAIDVVGNWNAGGKYSTLCRWLNWSSYKITDVPNGDILVAFDNEQIIGRTWNITPKNKVKVSVITNVIVAQLDSALQLQNRKDLRPGTWFTKERLECVLDSSIHETDDLHKKLHKLHFQHFKLFVESAIEMLMEDQNILQDCESQIHDKIDKLVNELKRNRQFKTCPSCDLDAPKSKRKCPNCKKDLVNLSNKTPEVEKNVPHFVQHGMTKKDKTSKIKTLERYDHIESSHPEKAVPVYVLDPVFVNQNSYDNLILVLRHIGKSAGISRYGGNLREWLIISCDGLPYTMLVRLCNEYLICTKCKKGFLGNDAFDSHKKEHEETEEVKFVKEFDWVLLHIGYGHYEMNLMKSFVELNWEVFMQMLVQRMGWTSEMALKSAKNCYDNHKTWQIILIFHIGTLFELLLPYVRACVSRKDNVSSSGFYAYAKSREKDPNYTYMFEMVSCYSQAIINFRMGVRRNNSELIQSAKMMSKGLFHGRNHPKYQQIEVIESIQRRLMPDELRLFIEKNESMTKTSDKSKGQGFDFILEEVNKDVKAYARHKYKM